MTSEYLLDAVGLLDDDLILDAETEYVSKSKAIRKQFMIWLPTAACVALLLITYPMFKGGAETGSASAPSAGDAAMSSTTGEMEYSSSQAASSSPSQSSGGSAVGQANTEIYVTLDGVEYIFHRSESAPIADMLPGDCRYLGQLNAKDSASDGDQIYTLFDTVYSDCKLWLKGDGADSVLYLELPEGGYLVCEHSRSHDFSTGNPDKRTGG